MTNKAIEFDFISTKGFIYGVIKVVGNLTHQDYEFFVPLFEQELLNIKNPKVRILVDLTEFTGWDLRAAWDDLKFGLKHNNEFTHIAVVGNNKLYEYGVKISNWFTHYEMQYFHSIKEAKEWMGV